MARGEDKNTKGAGLRIKTLKDNLNNAIRAKIKLPENNEHFTVWNHPENDWKLVKPIGIKQKWKSGELWWRSMVTDLEGGVLSVGLPKFKNYGEDSNHKSLLHKALEGDEQVLFTEKLDGSLAIRSVIDNEVVWRTRGSFGTEPSAIQRDLKELAQNYPLLNDPTYRPNESLHFEFRHPEHKVILDAPEPSLTLISGVDHEDLTLFKLEELKKVSEEAEIPLVDVHELPRNLDELLLTVENMKNSEGVVIRIQDEQIYLKLKSAEYLVQHRMKSNFTPAKALELCHLMKFKSKEEMIDHLYTLGLDWEVASKRAEYWDRYQDISTDVTNKLNNLKEFMNVYGDLFESDKKEFSRLVQTGYDNQEMRTSCFTLASGKTSWDELEKAMYKRKFDQAKKP